MTPSKGKNHLIQYLQGTNNTWLNDELVEDSKLTAFCVGKRIKIDGKIIKIGKRKYQVYDKIIYCSLV